MMLGVDAGGARNRFPTHSPSPPSHQPSEPELGYILLSQCVETRQRRCKTSPSHTMHDVTGYNVPAASLSSALCVPSLYLSAAYCNHLVLVARTSHTRLMQVHDIKIS